MGGSSRPFVSETGPRTSSSSTPTFKEKKIPSPTFKKKVPSPTTSKLSTADTAQVQRSKREDCRLPPAQEKLFSDWKVLVGPTDWHNHAAGVEGAERYRLHNLPSYLGPGVYELGLCNIGCSSHSTISSRHPRKDGIIIVYLGQAENVRTRLQHYGRDGSHLEDVVDSSHSPIPGEKLQAKSDAINKAFDSSGAITEKQDKCCLFTKTFSRGFSIVFRWTALESKRDAEAVEMGLLKMFDYAWNRGNNGRRRPYVAFETTQQRMAMFSMLRAHICSSADKWSKPLKWRFTQTGVGMTRSSGFKGKRSVITILKDKFRKPRKKSMSTSDNNKEMKLYKELRSLPWKMQSEEQTSSPSQKSKICGVTVTQGVVCTLAPKQGRNRCESHRGMKISCSRPSNTVIKKCTMAHAHAVKTGSKEAMQKVGDPNLLIHCGYLMENGLRCMVIPEKGRKRCTFHKGRRVKSNELQFFAKSSRA